MIIQGSIARELTSNLYKQSTKMTEEQSEKLSKLLSDIDTVNISTEVAQKIVTKVEDLRIIAASDLAAALADAGIDPSKLAEQAGSGRPEHAKGPPPPPPPQESQGLSSVDNAIVELIAQAVEAYDVSQEEDTTLGEAVLSALEKAGYDSSQPLIDFYA